MNLQSSPCLFTVYCVETRSLKKVTEKKLVETQAPHQRWLRKIAHIAWKHVISDEKFRQSIHSNEAIT